jgi:multidrug transporter EmrE-like cation transporter
MLGLVVATTAAYLLLGETLLPLRTLGRGLVLAGVMVETGQASLEP